MEFELLSEAPLFAMELLAAESTHSGKSRAPFYSDLAWPAREPCGLSDVLSSMLNFEASQPPSRTCSAKRTFSDSVGSRSPAPLSPSLSGGEGEADIFWDEKQHPEPLTLTPWDIMDELNEPCAPTPKRMRSNSFEQLLNELPTPTMPLSFSSGCGFLDIISDADEDLVSSKTFTTSSTVTKAEIIPKVQPVKHQLKKEKSFVFPSVSDSRGSKTPTLSPKKAVHLKPPAKPQKKTSINTTATTKKTTFSRSTLNHTVNSTHKPDFLKPMTNYERVQLQKAGPGTVLIRVNKDAAKLLEFC